MQHITHTATHTITLPTVFCLQKRTGPVRPRTNAREAAYGGFQPTTIHGTHGWSCAGLEPFPAPVHVQALAGNVSGQKHAATEGSAIPRYPHLGTLIAFSSIITYIMRRSEYRRCLPTRSDYRQSSPSSREQSYGQELPEWALVDACKSAWPGRVDLLRPNVHPAAKPKPNTQFYARSPAPAMCCFRQVRSASLGAELASGARRWELGRAAPLASPA